jgi:hypothetical protein
MPFRSLMTLRKWLDEFGERDDVTPGMLKVIQQDGDGGENTGLVAFRFENASTVAYVQPERPGSMTWMVTLEPRESSITIGAESVQDLAEELTLLSALCSFLQSKSEAFVGRDTA